MASQINALINIVEIKIIFPYNKEQPGEPAAPVLGQVNTMVNSVKTFQFFIRYNEILLHVQGVQ